MKKKIITILTLVSVMAWSSFIKAEASDVKLLFAYSSGCSHCAYQKPIIREFEEKHPEVEVSWVNYYNLDDEERGLIEGTSGHPVMVFHSGDHIRHVVGETSIDALEEEYGTFKEQLNNPGSSTTTIHIGPDCP